MSDLKWIENWKRAYRITVGTRETTTSTIDEKYTTSSIVFDKTTITDADYETTPSNARKLSNLSEDNADSRGFTFKLNAVHRVSEKGSEAENSTLDLYNIDEDLINVIRQDKCVVMVEAGYQDSVDLAYSGDVIKVTTYRQGADIVYRLHIKSSAFDMRNTLATLTYEEDLSDQDVILDMFGRLPNTAIGTYGLSDLADQKKTGGRGFTGSLITNIDKMAEKNNLNWCSFNGKIVIIPYNLTGDDYDKFARTNYNLPEDTLKKVTSISTKNDSGSTDIKSKLKKVQVNTFFIPVEIGQFITIPETEYTKDTYGTYQVMARRLILESKGQGWDVVLEAEELSQ